MESKKQVIDYSNNREITLEGETFLNIDVTEHESLIEVEFYEAE